MFILRMFVHLPTVFSDSPIHGSKAQYVDYFAAYE